MLDKSQLLLLKGVKYSVAELESMAHAKVEELLGNEIEVTQLNIFGSRVTDTHRYDSDLDIYLEYTGDLREDDVFNSLVATLSINGVLVDFFPVRK